MAVDWEDLIEKAGEELAASNSVILKQFTDTRGQTRVNRDLSEFAQLQSIARNQSALDERDNNGIIALMERHHD
jgi:hypothetical protein